jgi:SAM-dependent methyltransferase
MPHELFRVTGLPVLQNRVYESSRSAEASPKGDMLLVQDPSTGFVFNADFDAQLLKYDADYQNEQACSGVFRRHLDEVLAIVQRHFRTPSLIEVGCGKGYFLNHLRDAGYQATGIDPAYEGDSPHVIKAPFAPALNLSADGIVLRHVLEHIQQPLQFLEDVARANGQRGLIYIEVPCLDWICERRAWFDIFYEHVNYFRAIDFQRMFGHVHEQGHIFGGQYLYVVADLAMLREPDAATAERFVWPRDFLAGIECCKTLARATSGPKAIWGASSKGVIFSHHMRLAGIEFDLSVDINPAKQNRFMAGTGLKIVSPDSAIEALPDGSLVFVMNSNYYDEILQQSRGRFRLIKVDQNDIR